MISTAQYIRLPLSRVVLQLPILPTHEGSYVLCYATKLLIHYATLAEGVQQGRLAMVYVTHNGHNRRPWQQLNRPCPETIMMISSLFVCLHLLLA